MLIQTFSPVVAVLISMSLASVTLAGECTMKIAKEERTVKDPGLHWSTMGGQTTYTQTYSNITFLVVTGMADTITINKITVNRGNCSFLPEADLPKILKFGQTLSGPVTCNPIEVVVETDEDSCTSSWDQ